MGDLVRFSGPWTSPLQQLMSLCICHPSHAKLEKLEADYRQKNWELWVIPGNDSPHGLAGIIHEDADQITIRHFAVAAKHQKSGIGTKIIQGLRALFPKAVLTAETDEDAVGFYRKQGFSARSFTTRQGNPRFLVRLESGEAGKSSDQTNADH